MQLVFLKEFVVSEPMHGSFKGCRSCPRDILVHLFSSPIYFEFLCRLFMVLALVVVPEVFTSPRLPAQGHKTPATQFCGKYIRRFVSPRVKSIATFPGRKILPPCVLREPFLHNNKFIRRLLKESTGSSEIFFVSA